MYLKLPVLSRVKSYPDFYKKLLKLKTLEGTRIDVTKVYLTKENEEKLANHLKKIARKENKHLTNRGFDWSWGLEYLQFSPSTAECKYVKNGYAWVEGR